MDSSTVPQTLDAIQIDQFRDDAERSEALEAARRLVARLETPFESTFALTGTLPALLAGLQTCQNLGIWRNWTRKCNSSGNIPQRFDSILAMAESPVEANLLRRLLRHLAATNTLEETDAGEWKLTHFTMALGDETSNVGKAFAFAKDIALAELNLTPFLAKLGYKEPLDTGKFDNFAHIFGDVFFQYLQKNGPANTQWQGYMTAVRDYKMDWTEIFDTAKIVEDADLSEFAPPLFVDVGGMHGLDTMRLISKHPDLPETMRLVVQDLPEVVGYYSAQQKKQKQKRDPRLLWMAYDFFTPQPMVGARAYFFHAVPHDWADADCLVILANVRNVMTKGYSKLLICETVIPPKGASSRMTTLDLQLMSLVSGLERTEEQWRSLLEAAGFRILSISRHPRAAESIIEAEPF